MEVELLGDDGELCHILLMTAGVRRDEVGDDLFAEVLFTIDAVELALELIELLERGLAHEVQHTLAGMFGGYLQATRHMAGDEFSGVFLGGTVGCLILAAIQQEVVAHTTADEAALDARQGIDGMVDVEQLAVVGVEVRTDLRLDATGSAAFLTGVLVAPRHTVHIGRGSTEVGEIALEVGHLHHLLHLAQDALLRAAGDELTLMGRDGAEGTAAETAAMDVDAVLDHVVGGDALALVFGMGLTCVRQVEGGVELFGSHRGIGRIYHRITPIDTLQQALGMHHVRLLLDMAEVLGL